MESGWANQREVDSRPGDDFASGQPIEHVNAGEPTKTSRGARKMDDRLKS
jgi:hypothetical protein